MIKIFATALLGAMAYANDNELAEDVVNAFETFWTAADVNADGVLTQEEFVNARSAVASLPAQATMTLEEAIQAEYSFYLGQQTQLEYDETLQTLLEKVVPKVESTFGFLEAFSDTYWEQGAVSRDEFNSRYSPLLREEVDDAIRVFLETQRDAVFDFYDLAGDGNLDFAEVCLRLFEEDAMQLVCYDADPTSAKMGAEPEDQVAELFSQIDVNGDGFFDFDELEVVCPVGEWVKCEYKMLVTDPDDDGRVTIDDLRAAFDMLQWVDQNWDIIWQTLYIWDAEEGDIPSKIEWTAEFFRLNNDLYYLIGLPKLSREESDSLYARLAGEDGVLSIAEVTRYYMGDGSQDD